MPVEPGGARALGADHCINYGTTPEWGEFARELTGGRGVDSIVEIGGTVGDIESLPFLEAIRQFRTEAGRGNVLNATRDGFVPGAIVTLSNLEGLAPTRTTTAGPDGSFAFPGAIDGAFNIHVRDPGTGNTGSVSAVLPAGQPQVLVDVGLSARDELLQALADDAEDCRVGDAGGWDRMTWPAPESAR